MVEAGRDLCPSGSISDLAGEAGKVKTFRSVGTQTLWERVTSITDEIKTWIPCGWEMDNDRTERLYDGGPNSREKFLGMDWVWPEWGHFIFGRVIFPPSPMIHVFNHTKTTSDQVTFPSLQWQAPLSSFFILIKTVYCVVCKATLLSETNSQQLCLLS